MNKIPRPDLSNRKLKMTCEYICKAKPSEVYASWTDKFDLWFAQPQTLAMTVEIGSAYFFYNREEWGRHPHYGRFLDLQDNELVEMTWMTGDGTDRGTQGAETVLRIELSVKGNGTHIRLTHSGFPTEASRKAHVENWPLALQILDESLAG